MRTVRTAAMVLAAALALRPYAALAESAPAQPAGLRGEAAAAGFVCETRGCSMQLTAPQLMAMTEKMIADKQFDEARPLIAALRADPGMQTSARFLDGLIALETGDTATATKEFRAVLAEEPGLTRVRLELARALIAKGDLSAADYHLKLAENDGDLPPDIAREVRSARNVIRGQRKWQFGFDIGIAPDSNINSATSAETVNVNFGPDRLPLTLDEEAKSRSGTGITASMFGNLRLPASASTAIVADLDASMVNYDGKQFDDYSLQLAAGPEFRVSPATRLTLQGVGLMRWYGGNVAARQAGGKATLQFDIATGKRVGLQFDGRHTDSDFGEGYTGWQLGVVATYEQVIGKSAIASLALYGRRDLMKLESHSNGTIGATLGIGAELPLGINAGVSGGVSHARYDAPQPFFAERPDQRRADWRYNARVYAGLRKIRVLGFSPSIEYQFQKVDTNYALYRSNRHRAEFKLARYF